MNPNKKSKNKEDQFFFVNHKNVHIHIYCMQIKFRNLNNQVKTGAIMPLHNCAGTWL